MPLTFAEEKMKSFKSYIAEEEYPKEGKNGKKVSVGKNTVKINPNSDELKEVAPPGAKYERMVKHIKKAYSKNGLTDKEKSIAYATAWKQKNQESYVPGKPAERLGAVTAIPQSERDAAKARLLAKTAAKRKEMEKVREELEIEEGMTMKDFKANRKKNERRAASADAEKRGHVGKEWHNTGNKYTPDQAKSRRSNMSDYERQKRYQTSEDPDSDNAEDYPASKTKNPKKLRKQKAMGEAMSFSDFMEARRMDKEGVDRGDSRRAERADRAKASLAAKQKRQAVLDKYEKKTGTKLDISRSKEGKEHARNFPGSRQEPKEKGKKETPLETHNRRVSRSNTRVIKHGFTKKEKEANRGIYSSRFD